MTPNNVGTMLANNTASICTGLKSLISFKVGATTPNNTQQHGVQTDATCDTQQCWNNVGQQYCVHLHGAKKFDQFQSWCNNSQQHATTRCANRRNVSLQYLFYSKFHRSCDFHLTICKRVQKKLRLSFLSKVFRLRCFLT